MEARNNILSITSNDKNLTIKYQNNDDFKGVISVGAFTPEQETLFVKINNYINDLHNYGITTLDLKEEKRNKLVSHFSLKSIAYKEKANQYVFGGGLMRNLFFAYYPNSFAVPVVIAPETMENLQGTDSYEIMLLQQDIAVTVEALFMSFDIECFVQIKELPKVDSPQLKLPYASSNDHVKGLNDLVSDIHNNRLNHA